MNDPIFVAQVARATLVRKATGTWPWHRDALNAAISTGAHWALADLRRLTKDFLRSYGREWPTELDLTEVCGACGHRRAEHLGAKVCLGADGYFRIHPRQVFQARAAEKAA